MSKRLDVGDKRIGRFWIDLETVDDYPASALAMLEGCLVLRAECMWHRRCVEYLARHPDFDPVPAGEEAPTYFMEFGGDGVRRWVRT